LARNIDLGWLGDAKSILLFSLGLDQIYVREFHETENKDKDKLFSVSQNAT
jgi:hypothetical protein